MKILLRILLGLVVLFGLLFVIGLFLPDHSHVERSIVIDAPQTRVYELVNQLPEWHKWSAWHAMEPTAEYAYSDPPSGTNSWYTWKGEKIGEGKMTIVKAEPFERIDAEMEFVGQGEAEADFVFESTPDGQTKVTWMFDSDHAGSLDRWFGVMMDRMLGPDYEKGLAKLKTVAESDG